MNVNLFSIISVIKINKGLPIHVHNHLFLLKKHRIKMKLKKKYCTLFRNALLIIFYVYRIISYA